MKEKFFNETLNKVKKGAVIGATMIASFLPMENIKAQNNDKDILSKNNIELFKTSIENMTTEITTFKNFKPTPEENFIEIEDDILKAYIMDNYSINDFKGRDLNVLHNEAKHIKINDPEKFQKDILEVANSLGFSEEDIKKLSIHDAIMLSGDILAKKLTYYTAMINNEKDSNESATAKALGILQEALSGVDSRNEEAKRIDNEYQDKIFSEGLGICRNYAAVNMAIFEVLKKINKDNLKNTYMKWYSPGSLGESLALSHAWNQVINISNKNNKLKLLITYVDPTWLDTRKTTTDASGVESNISNEEIYNAFDPNHFFAGCLSAHVEIAMLYEFLGVNSNNISNEFNSKKTDLEKKNISNSYFDLAFSKRIEICKNALDSAQTYKNDVLKYEILFDKFKVSIMEAIANIQGSPVGMSSIVGPTFYDFYEFNDSGRFEPEKLIEIKNLLLRGEQIFSSGVDKTINIKSYDENFNEIYQRISIFDLGPKLDQLSVSKER